MADQVEARLRDVLREKGQVLFSGRIDVVIGGFGGVLHMSDGQVLDARLGTTTGEPALWRMLLADKTKISVEHGKARATSGAVLGKPDALLERFDERVQTLTRVADHLGGFERVWAIRFDALAVVLDGLPDAINPVLRLLDGKRTVRHVVAECGLDDMLALRILGKLLSRGILVLPDNVSLLPTNPTNVPIDVADEGLEAALAASLAEIDAEDEVEATRDPILLVPRAPPPAPIELSLPAASAHAPSSAAALPSAPRPATNDDLRSWLGNEEAFFHGDPRMRLPSGDVVIPNGPVRNAPRTIGVVPMTVLFVIAVVLGVLLASLR